MDISFSTCIISQKLQWKGDFVIFHSVTKKMETFYGNWVDFPLHFQLSSFISEKRISLQFFLIFFNKTCLYIVKCSICLDKSEGFFQTVNFLNDRLGCKGRRVV